ncbi:MAG: hypothetical protein WCR45_07775 [Bacteroidaceae bacterium]
MWGQILGGALGLGSAVVGGITSAKANKKANQMVADQKVQNQAWYDRKYNEDLTQRSDAQQLLEHTRSMLNDRTQRNAATNTVMGGTEEALAMDKANTNQAVADVTSNLAANQSAYKDNVEAQYMNNNAQLTQQQIQNQMNKSQQGANAMQQGLNSAAGVVGSIFDKK